MKPKLSVIYVKNVFQCDISNKKTNTSSNLSLLVEHFSLKTDDFHWNRWFSLKKLFFSIPEGSDILWRLGALVNLSFYYLKSYFLYTRLFTTTFQCNVHTNSVKITLNFSLRLCRFTPFFPSFPLTTSPNAISRPGVMKLKIVIQY